MSGWVLQAIRPARDADLVLAVALLSALARGPARGNPREHHHEYLRRYPRHDDGGWNPSLLDSRKPGQSTSVWSLPGAGPVMPRPLKSPCPEPPKLAGMPRIRMPGQRGDARSMHKITVQYFDPADGDDFETAYRERHVPLVQAVPGLERFTISFPHADGAPYLVAELWFADGDALSTARTSAEMAAVSADSATYDVARRVIFAGSVEDV